MRHSVGSTIHFWDGTNIAAEKTGSAVTVYFRALNLVYSQTGNTETFYVFNGHGDVIALTNASGTITRTYEYDAFGIEDEPSVYDTNPFRYCGEYYDTETKTLYLRARYYDASTGRFTAEDPIKDGANWYAYCGGNPVNFVDPSGLLPRKDVEMENLDDGYGGGETKKTQETNDTEKEEIVTSENQYKEDTTVEAILKTAAVYVAAEEFVVLIRLIGLSIKLSPSKIDDILVMILMIYGISSIPSKAEHYDRNEKNIVPINEDKAIEAGWTKKEKKDAMCHQYTAENGENVKYVSPDGRCEAIYDSQGRLVTAAEDEGTYNNSPATTFPGAIGHFFQDMVPWYLWGNSEKDKTTFVDRVVGSVGWVH